MQNNKEYKEPVVFPSPRGLVFRIGDSVYEKYMTPDMMVRFADAVLRAANRAYENIMARGGE